MLKLRKALEDESGLGLIEIVISMFLLALLAVSFLPLVISSFKLTKTNVTIGTASQLVSQQLDLARTQTPTCAGLTAFAAASIATTTDARGVVLQPRRVVACPGTYPGTATFTADVVESGSTTVLSTATTWIFVSAA
jgi:hypothetical protein